MKYTVDFTKKLTSPWFYVEWGLMILFTLNHTPIIGTIIISLNIIAITFSIIISGIMMKHLDKLNANQIEKALRHTYTHKGFNLSDYISGILWVIFLCINNMVNLAIAISIMYILVYNVTLSWIKRLDELKYGL